jgi:hypothetical protein
MIRFRFLAHELTLDAGQFTGPTAEVALAEALVDPGRFGHTGDPDLARVNAILAAIGGGPDDILEHTPPPEPFLPDVVY